MLEKEKKLNLPPILLQELNALNIVGIAQVLEKLRLTTASSPRTIIGKLTQFLH